jgi:hypothetical protein
MKIITVNTPIMITATTAAAVIGEMRIGSIYWFNPISVSDLAVLQDADGNSLWSGRCENANQSQLMPIPAPFTVRGYACPTLTSGTLYIYRV